MLLAIFMVICFNIFMKWNKTLMLIIFMECLSAVMLALVLIFSLCYYWGILFLFLFFVGEALIMLSSLYSTVRFIGIVQSNILLY